jgi:hypothetical protein
MSKNVCRDHGNLALPFAILRGVMSARLIVYTARSPLDQIRAIPSGTGRINCNGLQLFVNPMECIGMLDVACPRVRSTRYLKTREVPEEWHHYIEKNREFFAQ